MFRLLFTDQQTYRLEIPRLIGGVVEPSGAIVKPAPHEIREDKLESGIPPRREVAILEALASREMSSDLWALVERCIASRFPSRVIDVFFEEPGNAIVISTVINRDLDCSDSAFDLRMLMDLYIEAAPAIFSDFS